MLAEDEAVQVTDLPPEVLASDAPLTSSDAAAVQLPFLDARRRALAAFDRSFLAAAFEQHDRNVSRTAAALGLHRQTLQKLLTRYGVARPGRGDDPGAVER